MAAKRADGQNSIGTIKPKSYIQWQNNRYEILKVGGDSGKTFEARNLKNNLLETFSIDEVAMYQGEDPPLIADTLRELSYKAYNTRPPVSSAPESTIRPSLLSKADDVIRIVEEVKRRLDIEMGNSLRSSSKTQKTAATMRIIREMDIPSSTYYKYRTIYEGFLGDRTAIAAAFQKSTLNKYKMDPVTLCMIDAVITRYYARRDFRLPPSHIYDKIILPLIKRTDRQWIDPGKCRNAIPKDLTNDLMNEAIPFEKIMSNPERAALLSRVSRPSRGWFYAYLRWFIALPEDGSDLYRKRYGDEQWENEFMVFDTFFRNASHPLEMVFADHCLLDFFIVDGETRSKIDRLWLTFLIDAFSRSIIGFALLYESPCIESIQSALKSALSPKDLVLKDAGIENKNWLCYGIPQKLSLDNAWAHHSHSLENLSRNISFKGKYNSIQLEFRPPYKGRYGAIVERCFGTFSKNIRALMPGAIRGKAPQEIRDAAYEACLLYEDAVKIIVNLIVDYQNTAHSELNGMTPQEKWIEGIQSSRPLVPSGPAADRLFLRMSTQTRVITSQGISAFGMHYWSPQLAGIERVSKDGQKVQFGFSYDVNDISKISLFRDGVWVGDSTAKELRLPDGSYRCLSMVERELAQDIARIRGLPTSSWLGLIDKLEEMKKARTQEKKVAQTTPKRGRPSKKLPTVSIQEIEKAVGELSPEETMADEELAKVMGRFRSMNREN